MPAPDEPNPGLSGPEEIQWYRYVPHSEIIAYLARGWVWAADLGEHHGVYCCLMEWRGPGGMEEPNRDRG